MSVIVTDVDQIRSLIQEAVRDAVESELPDLVRKATQKKWLTRDELRELTGWSYRTIQHLRDSRQIPFSQHGRKIVYPTAGIEQFLGEHKIKPKNQ